MYFDPEPISELHLLEGVLQQPVFGLLVPRTGELVLVEDAELHALSPNRLLAIWLIWISSVPA